MLWGLLIVGIVVVVGVISLFNGFVKLRNMVEEAFATMDVYMKKRYDLIPNLVAAIKGYTTHEKETLERVILARNQAMGAKTLEERQSSENALTGTLKSLFALSENYPDLKADSQFLDLQKQLQKTEEDIANARKYYNAIVKKMNTKVDSFPSNIVAMLFGFKRADFFTAETAARENVKVEF